MSLTFCLGKFTLSLWSSWWTSPILKVPSPFLSASEKVCCNHVHPQIRLNQQIWVWVQLLILNCAVYMNAMNFKKDIDPWYAVCGPDCLHHWSQPWGTLARWSRCARPLHYWRPGPGTWLDPRSKYWNNSLGRNGFLHSAGRSLISSPHRPRGWNQSILEQRRDSGFQIVLTKTAENKLN